MAQKDAEFHWISWNAFISPRLQWMILNQNNSKFFIFDSSLNISRCNKWRNVYLNHFPSEHTLSSRDIYKSCVVARNTVKQPTSLTCSTVINLFTASAATIAQKKEHKERTTRIIFFPSRVVSSRYIYNSF